MDRFAPLTFAVILSFIAVGSAGSEPVPVVRVLSPRLAQTLCDAALVSSTLRTLLRDLERSDLIVHVVGRSGLVPPAFATRRLAGTIRFVTATPTRRFVRITVDESLPPKALAAVLAHELWHALEVAREPQVVDQDSFEALYRDIGHHSFGSSTWYDTQGAVAAGSSVLVELRRKVAER
jgi:hypothetical protein